MPVRPGWGKEMLTAFVEGGSTISSIFSSFFMTLCTRDAVETRARLRMMNSFIASISSCCCLWAETRRSRAASRSARNPSLFVL